MKVSAVFFQGLNFHYIILIVHLFLLTAILDRTALFCIFLGVSDLILPLYELEGILGSGVGPAQVLAKLCYSYQITQHEGEFV